MLLRVTYLLMGLLLLLPGLGEAQQQFGVTVPGRVGTADGLPISRIKITLHVDSSPAGATLSREGGPSGLGFSASAQAFGGGDMVRFQEKGGDTIEIELLPFSNLSSPVDKCERASGGTTEFNMELSGAPAITGYQLTSYRAPNVNYGCSCASRRIVAQPSQWGSPPFGAPSGTDLGRQSLTMIMVLDESGSMGSTLTPGETRMDRLNQHAGNVVDLWDLAGGPADDRLGIIYFTTGVNALTFPPDSDFFVRRDASASGGTWADLESVLRGRTPKNLTAMGDGLKEAFDRRGTLDDVAIVLFTDGIENRGAYRTKPCSDLPPGVCPSPVPTDTMYLHDAAAPDLIEIPGRCVLTQTIGVGAPGARQTDILDRISTQTGGKSKAGLDADVMTAGSFEQALLDLLDAASLHEVFRAFDTLGAEENEGIERRVVVNGSVDRMLATLSWYGNDEADAFSVRFTDPDGETRRPTRETRRQDYLVASLDLNETDAGEWVVSVTRGESSGSIDYELATMLDDSVLDYNLAWHRSHYFTGDPAYLVLTVTENGTPASGLSADSVEASLLRAPGGIGTELHERSVPDSVLRLGTAGTAGDPPATAYARKVQYLLEDTAFVQQIRPVPSGGALPVRAGPIEGPDGGTIGGDGDYVIAMPETDVPGIYEVRVRFRGELEASGFVDRTETVQVPVHVRPNLAESQVQADPGDGAIQLQFVPRDLFGNYLGPGYAQSFDVTVDGQSLPVNSRNAGTRGVYDLTVEDVAVDDNPRLVFYLAGRPYHAATVDQIVSGNIPQDPGLDEGEAPPPEDDMDVLTVILLILLVLLIVVAVVLFVRRRGVSGA